MSVKKFFSFSKKQIDYSFKNSIESGRVFGLKFLKVFSKKLNAEETERDWRKLLIVVPRSFGNACKRNRIRRQLKMIFYTEQLFICKYDFIIIVREKAASLSFNQLKKILLRFCRDIA